jgi:hypothetical protein
MWILESATIDGNSTVTNIYEFTGITAGIYTQPSFRIIYRVVYSVTHIVILKTSVTHVIPYLRLGER